MNQDHIRNFCIVAHIDHGKSTLADRMLELTGTVEKRNMKAQMLDKMDLEREKGITIKLAPVRMMYRHPQILNPNHETLNKSEISNQKIPNSLGFRNSGLEFANSIQSFELNLIDTPGHVDFSYEVSRSLAACEGALLVVDASQGIQAQTLANVYLALEADLKIIPVLNKIDLPAADVDRVSAEIVSLLGCKKEDILHISAKTGQGVEAVLERIVSDIPPPKGGVVQSSELLHLDAGQGSNEQRASRTEKYGERAAQEADKVMRQEPAGMSSSARQQGGVVQSSETRALIFDSYYDDYRGVILYIRVVDGQIAKNSQIKMMATKAAGIALEVGALKPEMSPCKELKTGEIGYVVTNLKSTREAKVGDTVTTIINDSRYKRYTSSVLGDSARKQRSTEQGVQEVHRVSTGVADTAISQESRRSDELRLSAGRGGTELVPLEGYKEVKPFVYAGIFPESNEFYQDLKDAIEKLILSDSALQFEPENSPVLGFGVRVGFLGLLHMDIVRERLEREYNLSLIITNPSTDYQVSLLSGEEVDMKSATDLPDPAKIREIREPWIKGEIVVPKDFLGAVLQLVMNKRGLQKNVSYVDARLAVLDFEAPLANLLTDFYDQLKSVTSGYGSFNYELADYRPEDLVKLDFYIAGDRVDALSLMVHRSEAQSLGRSTVEKLKEVIPRQNFQVSLQAGIGGKFIAREDISAYRKDVTTGLYGGDVSRKKKVLAKQAKGKKRLKRFGKVDIPAEAFTVLLKRD